MASQVDGTKVPGGDAVLPSRVRIVHKMVGDVHVFTANAVDDFQVADRDLRTAFSAIPQELHDIVVDPDGNHPPYVLTLTYEEYRNALYGAHRDPGASAALYAVIPENAHMVDPNMHYVPPARLRREALLRSRRGAH